MSSSSAGTTHNKKRKREQDEKNEELSQDPTANVDIENVVEAEGLEISNENSEKEEPSTLKMLDITQER